MSRAAEPHASAVRAHETDHHREDRRLAGAVRAEEADDLPRRDLDGDVAHDRASAVGLDEAFGGEERPDRCGLRGVLAQFFSVR